MRFTREVVFWVLFLTLAGGLWAVANDALESTGTQDTIVPTPVTERMSWPMPNTNYRPLFLVPEEA